VPIRFLLALAATLFAASPAAAWWEYGDESVARGAMDSVRPARLLDDALGPEAKAPELRR
jgi:hypothetical protein